MAIFDLFEGRRVGRLASHWTLNNGNKPAHFINCCYDQCILFDSSKKLVYSFVVKLWTAYQFAESLDSERSSAIE